MGPVMKTSDCEGNIAFFCENIIKIERNKVLKFYLEKDAFRLIEGLNDKEVGVGQAHSKIILIGEHAVVYGYPAISLPLLEVKVTCRVVPAATPWRLFEEDTLSMAVYASLEYLNIKDADIRCQIDSAIPEKRGMGSSAAISIAAIRAVFDYYQAELPDDVLEISGQSR